MAKFTDIFNGIIAVAGTCVTFLFGGWDIVLNSLIILMAVDYATGLMKGYVNKDLSSSTSARGLFKKIMILLILIVGVALDRMLGTGEHMFRTLVAFFYISNESLSIIENATQLGVPVPQQIQDALEQLKNNNVTKPIIHLVELEQRNMEKLTKMEI